jgi:hypothetical protein
MTLERPMFPPVDPTRCRFLSNAAGGTILALAAIPPTPTSAAPRGLAGPIFSLIEAHRRARAAYLVALAEQNRLDEIGDRTADWVAAKQCDADIAALENLVETASTTFAGLVAWRHISTRWRAAATLGCSKKGGRR